MDPSRRTQWLQVGRAASAGYFIIVATGLGAGAGWFADKYLGTQPWGLLVGFLLGVVASIRELYNIAKTTRFDGPSDSGKGGLR